LKRIHIVGRKNSGKTTLVVALVEHLTAQGYRVGTIKHTHHRHELDTPGKDSFQHREAGAAAVGILSPAMDAVFVPERNVQRESSSDESRYDRLDSMFADCDLVLVEGHSQCQGTRLEVWRAVNQTEPIAADDTNMVALITDDPIEINIPIWPRSDVAKLANNILELAKVTRR